LVCYRKRSRGCQPGEGTRRMSKGVGWGWSIRVMTGAAKKRKKCQKSTRKKGQVVQFLKAKKISEQTKCRETKELTQTKEGGGGSKRWGEGRVMVLEKKKRGAQHVCKKKKDI